MAFEDFGEAFNSLKVTAMAQELKQALIRQSVDNLHIQMMEIIYNNHGPSKKGVLVKHRPRHEGIGADELALAKSQRKQKLTCSQRIFLDKTCKERSETSSERV